MSVITESNVERYHVQSHGGSSWADLEYDEKDGHPILTATSDKPDSGISREFRWAYGNRIWVIRTNGEKMLYEGITQCWLDENDQVYRLCGRPVYSEWIDLEARHYDELI